METIIVIVAVIAFVIYLYSLNSDKESTKERVADGVSDMLADAAESVGSVARSIAEPKDKKIIREATEALASRNGLIYRCDHPSADYKDKMFEVNDSFRKSLEVLGLTEDEWKNKVAIKLFYIGQIKMLSRSSSDYSVKKDVHLRQNMMSTWKSDSILKKYIVILEDALSYYGIPEEEWVQYGDAVIEMHNLADDEYLKEYGVICRILPTRNNKHLL